MLNGHLVIENPSIAQGVAIARNLGSIVGTSFLMFSISDRNSLGRRVNMTYLLCAPMEICNCEFWLQIWTHLSHFIVLYTDR
jgi:hypothetical protein